MGVYFLTLTSVFFFAGIAKKSYNVGLSAGLEAENANRKNNIYYFCVFIAAVILICVAGFRYKVGTDYGNYVDLYLARKSDWFSVVKSLKEPAYALLCKISSVIYDDYATMFFVSSLITIGLYVRSIEKYSTNILFSIALFIFVGTWTGTFSGVRQYLAAAILFAGHRYMYDRKFWKYLLVVLAASAFHITALIMLPVYFIANKRISVKSILLILAMTIVLRLSYDYIFSLMSFIKNTELTEYDYMLTEVNIFRILVTLAPITLYFGSVRSVREDPETQFYSLLMFVNAAFMVATSNSAYLARVGIFTETFLVFAYPRLTKGYAPNIRAFLKATIVILYFFYFLHQLNVSPDLGSFRWIFGR